MNDLVPRSFSLFSYYQNAFFKWFFWAFFEWRRDFKKLLGRVAHLYVNRCAYKRFRGVIFRSSFGLLSVFAIYEAEISPKFLLRPAPRLRWSQLIRPKNVRSDFSRQLWPIFDSRDFTKQRFRWNFSFERRHVNTSYFISLVKLAAKNRGAHEKSRGAIFRPSFGLLSALAIYGAEISAKFLLCPVPP